MVDFSARRYETYHDKTVEQCKQLCKEDKRCKAFDYFHDYGGEVIPDMWKENDCTLRGSKTTVGVNRNNKDAYVLLSPCVNGKCVTSDKH